MEFDYKKYLANKYDGFHLSSKSISYGDIENETDRRFMDHFIPSSQRHKWLMHYGNYLQQDANDGISCGPISLFTLYFLLHKTSFANEEMHSVFSWEMRNEIIDWYIYNFKTLLERGIIFQESSANSKKRWTERCSAMNRNELQTLLDKSIAVDDSTPDTSSQGISETMTEKVLSYGNDDYHGDSAELRLDDDKEHMERAELQSIKIDVNAVLQQWALKLPQKLFQKNHITMLSGEKVFDWVTFGIACGSCFNSVPPRVRFLAGPIRSSDYISNPIAIATRQTFKVGEWLMLEDLKDKVKEFARKHSFEVARGGRNLHCNRGYQNLAEADRHRYAVPNAPQRNRETVMKCICPWKITFSEKKDEQGRNKITKVIPYHGNGCKPSLVQALAVLPHSTKPKPIDYRVIASLVHERRNQEKGAESET
jgi:hypothetical protein